MTEKQKTTVAFFLPTLEPGGTERNVVNLVNNIDKEKYTVALILGNKVGDFVKEINENIPIINLRSSTSFGLFFALVAYFKKEKPNIFVSAFPRINIICIVANFFSQTKTKIIITEHSVFSLLPVIAKTRFRRAVAHLFMPSLSKFMYPKADAIICVSKGIQKDLLAFLPYPEKIAVIGNPVISEQVETQSQEPVLHDWFSDSHIPIVLAVGRLVECKDYPTLLKAFQLVVKKQPARLVVLGKGPMGDDLVKLSNELGLTTAVAFLGFQENPYKYMKKASVFVLSSLQEGFGNVIIEAMACGLPVISTDCPIGPGEIIENGQNGMLVSVGDYNMLAHGIEELLQNTSLREKFSRNGKKRAQDFSVISSVRKYEEIFRKLSPIAK